jgi:hypothetical protein
MAVVDTGSIVATSAAARRLERRAPLNSTESDEFTPLLGAYRAIGHLVAARDCTCE